MWSFAAMRREIETTGAAIRVVMIGIIVHVLVVVVVVMVMVVRASIVGGPRRRR